MAILIADHDEDNLKILSLKLETQGFKIIQARDGQEAWTMIREQKPDLLILDIMMPKISGFKLARMVKFDSKLKSIPLILLTARTEEIDKDLGTEVGADLYMTKPYDLEQLIKEVRRLLEKGAAEEGTPKIK